jgi:lipopolysaccharide biosynthesis glycosyltransferase
MKSDEVKIWIGLDSSHTDVYDICKFSIETNTTEKLPIYPINKYTVSEYRRNVDPTESTDFSFARFFVPYCSNFNGISIFLDGDFLFLDDIKNLLDLYDERYAIMCCKHEYTPKTSVKMDGKIQTTFPKKNWSSLMIFNNEHPKIKTLSPGTINFQSGKFLHQFKFLEDDDIGSLPIQWNWLVGWYKEPSDGSPKALHFTEGGPWLNGYETVEYSDVYNTYRKNYERRF